MATTRKPTPQAQPATTHQAVAKPVVKKATRPAAPTKVTAPAGPKAVKTPKAAAPQNTKAAPAKVEKKVKAEKIKVVRDSFTIPKSEYAAIADLKKRALGLGVEAKKSELLRAGLMLLAASTDAAFGKALAQVPTLKTGRPGKA